MFFSTRCAGLRRDAPRRADRRRCAARDSRFAAERASRIVTVSLDDKVDPLWTLVSRIVRRPSRGVRVLSNRRCAGVPRRLSRRVAAALEGEHFDAVHVMRSYMAPMPTLLSGRAGRRRLLRASTSTTTRRPLTAARRGRQRAGAPDDARYFAAEAAKYERFERLWLPRFRLLFACGDAHAQSAADIRRAPLRS